MKRNELGQTGVPLPVGTTVEGPGLFWGPSHLLLHEVRSPCFSFVPLLWTLVVFSVLKTLEVNPRQTSVCQAVPKMQGCREWVSFHPGVSRTCCELMDSLQPGFLSAADSLNPEKTINTPAKWQVCRRACWPVFERMLYLDVFSTSLFLLFTGETGSFFLKRC